MRNLLLVVALLTAVLVLAAAGCGCGADYGESCGATPDAALK